MNRTLTSWYVIGLLMLPGIFMPLCQGCGSSVVYPLENLQPSTISFANVQGVLITFCVPLLIAVLLTLVRCLKSRRLLIGQFWLQIALMTTAIVAAVVMEFSHESAEELTRSVLAVLPVAIGLPIWIGSPVRQRQWTFAWGRLQQLTILMAWVCLNLWCLFRSTLLIGYWYTSALMIGAVWIAEVSKGRMAHDLWDANEPIQRFQFSMKQVFLWMTILPLVAAYYAYLDAAIDWMF